VRRFTTWLLEEGEIDYDPFLGLRPPKLDVRVVEPLSDDQLRALLKACAGTEFRDRRDEAVLRLTATHTRIGWLSRHVRWLSTGVPGVEPG
jgi:site-specific recombinase XerC